MKRLWVPAPILLMLAMTNFVMVQRCADKTPKPEPTPFISVPTRNLVQPTYTPTPPVSSGIPMPQTIMGVVLRGRYGTAADGSRSYLLTVSASDQGVTLTKEVQVPTQEEWATFMLIKRACVPNPDWFSGASSYLYICKQ